MKSKNTLVGISLLCLALAVLAATLAWGDVASPVKIGMYALGFSTGVAVGALIVKRQIQLTD